METRPDPVSDLRRTRKRTHPAVILALLLLAAGGASWGYARGWVWWQVLLAAITAPLAVLLVLAVLALIFVLLLVKKGYRQRP